MVKVRGTRFNTGLMTRAALGIGAQGVGQWAGAHATPLDNDVGDYGSLDATDQTSRVSYPYGLMVNLDGQRFCDEGEDFKLYTYAKTGARILEQRYGITYQIFDQKTVPLLEKRYRTGKPETANTLEELADKLAGRSGDLGFNKSQFLKTVAEFNDSVGETEFNSLIKDGKHTSGLGVNKTNWAQRIDKAPYVAYPVTTGITFTFGGLRINGDAQVVDLLGRPIPGLYATGEATGGFFYYNYPGGAGLMRGAVFGRRAGTHAANSSGSRPTRGAVPSKRGKASPAKAKAKGKAKGKAKAKAKGKRTRR
jgi:tricarballylate dehydrogenase